MFRKGTAVALLLAGLLMVMAHVGSASHTPHPDNPVEIRLSEVVRSVFYAPNTSC